MSRSIISRLGAGLVAAAIVAGGSLLVAPAAMAAGGDETLVLAKTTYVENDWADGVNFTGANYPAGQLVEVSVNVSNGQSGDTLGSVEVTADAAGVITGGIAAEDLALTSVPSEGFQVSAVASYTPAGGGTPFFAQAPIEITPFVADPNPTTSIVPTCLTGAQAQTDGVEFAASGYAQFEENVTFSVKDSGGTVVGNGVIESTDATGTARYAFRLFTTTNGVESGPIKDGVYSVTVTNGTVGSFAFFTVGNCDTPVAPVDPAVPAAVPAAPQLANTGSSDAGILVGGSALLLLVGAALVVARRRQNAAA